MKNYFLNYIEQLKTNKLINIYLIWMALLSIMI